MSDFNSANFTVVPTPVADPLSGSRPSVHTATRWDIGPVGELWSPFSSISTLGCCVMRCQGSWCHGAISEMSLSLHPLLWHRLCLSRLCSLFNGWCGAQGLSVLSLHSVLGASLSPALKDTFMPPIPLLAAAALWWLRTTFLTYLGSVGRRYCLC